MILGVIKILSFNRTNVVNSAATTVMPCNQNRSEVGAAMLEFSLVAGVFFATVFGTLEITRFLSIDVAVASANSIATNYARKVSYIDEDLRTCPDNDLKNCLAYRRLIDARKRVQTVVRKISGNLVGYGPNGASTRSSTNLLRYRNIDFIGPRWVAVAAEDRDILDVLILRPGDAVEDLQEADPNKKYLCHPVIRPFGYANCANPTGAPFLPGYFWRDIIQNESIIVGVDTDFKTLFPLETLFSLAINLIATEPYLANQSVLNGGVK